MNDFLIIYLFFIYLLIRHETTKQYFFVTKIPISTFIKNIFYKQIKIKTISAPLGSTLITTTHVINNCAYIPGKKRVNRSGLVTTITFLCARAVHISYKSRTLTRILF